MHLSGPASAHGSMFSLLLQDLPDVQELITQVRSEKCSLQAAAILGELCASSLPPVSPDSPSLLLLFSPTPSATGVRLKGVVSVHL